MVLLGVIGVLKMVPTNYQDRHLLLFLPAVCLLAALKLQSMETAWKARCTEWEVLVRRNGLAALMLGFLMVFSAAVLVLQKYAFGDILRGALYLRTLPADAVVYSDEQFKTEYAAHRPIRLWTPELRDLNPGDYLFFHTFSPPHLNVLQATLERHFQLEVVHRDFSYLVPLLTDLMMEPRLQNRPQATAVRFEPQYFETRVCRVVKRILTPHEVGWE